MASLGILSELKSSGFIKVGVIRFFVGVEIVRIFAGVEILGAGVEILGFFMPVLGICLGWEFA